MLKLIFFNKFIFSGLLFITSFNVRADSAFTVLYAWNQQDQEFQVLMGHGRESGYKYWNLLGGTIDSNESPNGAACREVYEESVRWFGRDLSNNLNGKHHSFSHHDLNKNYFSFQRHMNGQIKNRYLFFKEVPYLDPHIITESLSQETEDRFLENDDYGWLPWRKFAYHAVKSYRDHTYPQTPIHENMKGSSTTETLCRDFTWDPFKEARSINHLRIITNQELSKQGKIQNVQTSDLLYSYLNSYYTNINNNDTPITSSGRTFVIQNINTSVQRGHKIDLSGSDYDSTNEVDPVPEPLSILTMTAGIVHFAKKRRTKDQLVKH